MPLISVICGSYHNLSPTAIPRAASLRQLARLVLVVTSVTWIGRCHVLLCQKLRRCISELLLPGNTKACR